MPPSTAFPPPEPPADPAAQAQTSGVAIAALILALIPLFCINVVGVVLGIVAIIQIGQRPRELKGQGLAIAAIVVGVMWFVVIIFAAIAIPNFMKYQARARQSEAKVSLKAVYSSAKAAQATTGNYPTTFDAIQWFPDGDARYSYFLGADAIPAAKDPVSLPPGISATADNPESFRAVAAGNIDGDETLDIWSIDQTGKLQNVVNDVDQ